VGNAPNEENAAARGETAAMTGRDENRPAEAEENADARRSIRIFLVISALVGLGMGLSDAIIANYFKDAYDISARQRGFIELPRELPGVVSIFIIAALAPLKNIRGAVAAQLLTIIGLVVLGLVRPAFPVMLVFLFIYSCGTHMYIPLGDSIGLSLARRQDMGRTLGRFNSMRMAFLMVAGIVTFVGFRSGCFSFDTPVAVFLLSAACFTLAALLLVRLRQSNRQADDDAPTGAKFIWRREYLRYYIICALFGGRKQIMLVYSPWVLIDLLDFKADTMSILAVAGALIGVFFMPVVGRWIDRYGVRTVMTVEALAFVLIYVAYGFLSQWVSTRTVALSGLIMLLVYLLNIVDRMSAQFAMVRAIYMRSIALSPEEVTPSLSLGMSIDHVVAIAGSYACGLVWFLLGPQYVFLIAGALSLLNLLAARGIRGEV
jgi:predicted MFS family arabinose efflux permease